MYSNFEMTYNSYLMHHGTKGMKWGGGWHGNVHWIQ